MNSSRRKLAAILDSLGLPPLGRKHAPNPASPACEPLEGRQLMTGGMGMAGLGLGLADVSGLGTSGWVASPGAIAFGGGGGNTSATNGSLNTDLAKLQSDTQMIQDQSLVTPAMTSAVSADIKAIKSAETTTAGAGMLAFLQSATKAVNAAPGGPTLGQAFQLQAVQNAVYLSEGVGTTLVDKLDTDRMAVMMATGITAAEEATLAADHAAITADQSTARAISVQPIGIASPLATSSATTATPTSPAAAPTSGMPGMPGESTLPGELQAAGAGVLVAMPTGFGGGLTGPGEGSAIINDLGMPVIHNQAAASSPAEATLRADEATLETASTTLRAEIQTVQATSNVTPAMQAVIRADLAAVRGATSVAPNAADEAKLKADYTTAMTNLGGPTAAQLAQIQGDQAAVYESQGVSSVLVQKLQAAQAVVTAASGITGAEQGAIYADEMAVEADQAKVKADVQALPPTTTTTTTTPSATGMFPGSGPRGLGREGFNPLG